MEFNVLSLFGGIEAGKVALDREGIKVDNYYSSEIDKYAISITKYNHPDIIHLGDVRDIDTSKLPKINMVIGGSPCQSFSFAGKRKGMSTKDNIEILTLEHYLELKEQNFEFEGQSYLFWEFMRIKEELNPQYFFLENVEMGAKWEKVLSRAIGINPIRINSALVSGQHRSRLYWTNIGAEQTGFFGHLECKIPQPKDKGILLKDVLDKEVDEKYYLSEKALKYINSNERDIGFQMNDEDEKSSCITAVFSKQIPYNQIVVHNTMPRSSKTGKGGTGPLSRTDGKTYCLDTGNTNAIEITRDVIQLNPSKESGGKQPYQQNRVYDANGISPALCADKSDLIIREPDEVLSGTLRTHNDGKGFREVKSGKAGTIPARAREDGSGQNVVSLSGVIRRLTPQECEKLQTFPINYTKYGINENGEKAIISDTRRYKALGNSWTVDVIAHIFKYIN